MSKRAKCNISCGGKIYIQGEIYEDSAVVGLDQNDFETVETTQTSVPEQTTIREKKEQADGGAASSVISNQVSTGYEGSKPTEVLE